MNTSRFISRSEAETKKFAKEFARTLKGSEKISLLGPLGAGKTTFVRGFVEAFGIAPDDVQSPTFTLVREYTGTLLIYHIDLYRFEKEEEIFEAGIYDILHGSNLVLIEWADKLTKYPPDNPIVVQLDYESETDRVITVDSGQ